MAATRLAEWRQSKPCRGREEGKEKGPASLALVVVRVVGRLLLRRGKHERILAKFVVDSSHKSNETRGGEQNGGQPEETPRLVK